MSSCYRQLGEKERLARTLVQMSALLGKGSPEGDNQAEKAEEAFREVQQLVKEIGEKKPSLI